MNEQVTMDTGFPFAAADSVEPLRQAVEFDGEPGCIARARHVASRFLQQLQAEWLAVPRPRLGDDLLLVVSELVTNAERHSHGPYVLELEGTDTHLSVSVYDSSSALPRWYEPDPTRLGGHGLEIVRAVADRVTAERVPVGKRVTAAFALPPRAAV